MPQQRLELVVDLVERDLEVDAQLGNEVVLASAVTAATALKRAANSATRSARDRHAGGDAMPAEPQQQITALGEPAVEIERADRTARPFSLLALERDQHGRSSELLDDPRRDDPDHAGMPSLFGEHDAVRRREIHREHELARLLERRRDRSPAGAR